MQLCNYSVLDLLDPGTRTRTRTQTRTQTRLGLGLGLRPGGRWVVLDGGLSGEEVVRDVVAGVAGLAYVAYYIWHELERCADHVRPL